MRLWVLSGRMSAFLAQGFRINAVFAQGARMKAVFALSFSSFMARGCFSRVPGRLRARGWAPRTWLSYTRPAIWAR